MAIECAPLSREPRGPPVKQVYAEWQQIGVKNRQIMVEKLLLSGGGYAIITNMYHNSLTMDATAIGKPKQKMQV